MTWPLIWLWGKQLHPRCKGEDRVGSIRWITGPWAGATVAYWRCICRRLLREELVA